MIKGDKCTFGSLELHLQNFDLIGDFCIILHCLDELASIFEEFDHLSLVAVVLDHHDLVMLFIQLYLTLEFVFDLLIDLLLEVLSESLAQFQARILMLNTDELSPCLILYF